LFKFIKGWSLVTFTKLIKIDQKKLYLAFKNLIEKQITEI